MQKQVWTELEERAINHPSSDVAKAISILAEHKNDQDIEKLYGWMMSSAYKIDAWQASGGLLSLAKKLGIPEDLTEAAAMEDMWRGANIAQIKSAAEELLYSTSKNDKTRGSLILGALGEADKCKAFSNYCSAFFKKAGQQKGAGEFYKAIVSKQGGNLPKSLFGILDSPGPEALRIAEIQDRVRAAKTLELSGALYNIATLAVPRYRALKTRQRVMDFDDQIHLVRSLLIDKAASDWVRYKLDGGIDHILVDEAQDTSAVQWDIVGALSDPFFQPSPDSDQKNPHTLFAVGDEKQSIYSFQGAEPELFLGKLQALTKKQAKTPEVNMAMSFRSSSKILNLVDEVFYGQGGIQESLNVENLAPASDRGSHISFRANTGLDDSGLIEFWPAVIAPEKIEDETSWMPVPVDAPSAQSTREQLARQIAVQIKTWLETKEPIYDRDLNITRPMRASDIMVLVTKRADFFDGLIRNLEEQGVPVAGADRLKLTDFIAIKDLLSLAKFTLLPSDDLSLAEVLKSPLFGWDDTKLFDVAVSRTGSLWSAMPQGEDKNTLQQIKNIARNFAPYEFFSRALALVPSQGKPSLLQKIYTRIGLEAADIIDAFLSRALAHQRRGAPCLAAFIYDIENDENKIKRELSGDQNEVRVMTIHGAKGLESPVVILPDTTQVKTMNNELLLEDGLSGFVLKTSGALLPEKLSNLQEERQKNMARESMRLLYVALTRAESRLLICGFQSNKKVAEGSWHTRIKRALTAMKTQELKTEFGLGLIYGNRAIIKEALLQKPSNVQTPCLPSWARETFVHTQNTARRISPSKLFQENDDTDFGVAIRSPLESKGGGPNRFMRGNIIHKLLQYLPDIAEKDRRTAAQAYLQKQGSLKTSGANQIEKEVFAILEHKDFAPFFSKSSMSEVSLAGQAKNLPGGISFNGQIDRLCVIDNIVWILDYKSNRPPPQNESGVAGIYVRQMAAYRALARDIFPDKTIRTALLWTDGPRLMPLSDELLDSVNWESVLT